MCMCNLYYYYYLVRIFSHFGYFFLISFGHVFAIYNDFTDLPNLIVLKTDSITFCINQGASSSSIITEARYKSIFFSLFFSVFLKNNFLARVESPKSRDRSRVSRD